MSEPDAKSISMLQLALIILIILGLIDVSNFISSLFHRLIGA